MTLRLELDGVEPLDLDDHDSTGIIVEAYELTPPNVRDVVDDRPGADGTFDATAYAGGRGFTLSGTVWATDTRSRTGNQDRLLAFCDPAARPWLYVSTELGERRIQLRINDQPSFPTVGSDEYRPLSAGWRVALPHPEAAEAIEVWLSPLVATPGRTYSRSYPRTYPAGGGAGVTIRNDGNAPAEWVARIFGPCDDPVLTHVDSGEAVSFTDLSIDVNDFLELDSREQTARLNGLAGANRFGLLDDDSDWFPLAPGPNTVTFAATSPGAVSKTEIVTRSTYRSI